MICPSKINKDALKTGDVIVHSDKTSFLNPKTWASYLVQRVTNSPFNHTSEILVIDGVVWVVEALLSGMYLRTFDDFVKDHMEGKKVLVMRYKYQGKFEEDKYIDKALMELYKEYDFFGLGTQLIWYLMFWIRTEKCEEQAKRAWRCSEFNGYMKEVIGRQKFVPKDFVKHPDFDIINVNKA